MMRDIILNGRPLLLEDNSTSIFQDKGIDEENDVLLYGKYDHEKLAKQYMTVQTAQYTGTKLEDLKEEQSNFKEDKVKVICRM